MRARWCSPLFSSKVCLAEGLGDLLHHRYFVIYYFTFPCPRRRLTLISLEMSILPSATLIIKHDGACLTFFSDDYQQQTENLSRADVLALAGIIQRINGLALFRIKCITLM